MQSKHRSVLFLILLAAVLLVLPYLTQVVGDVASHWMRTLILVPDQNTAGLLAVFAAVLLMIGLWIEVKD